MTSLEKRAHDLAIASIPDITTLTVDDLAEEYRKRYAGLYSRMKDMPELNEPE